VAPVHEAVAPRSLGDISGGTLGEVAVNVADDLAHVAQIAIGEFVLLLAKELDDAATGAVTDRLAAGALVADGL
jgi:hypothetical protein